MRARPRRKARSVSLSVSASASGRPRPPPRGGRAGAAGRPWSPAGSGSRRGGRRAPAPRPPPAPPRAVDHRHRDRAVERHHRRRPDAQQRVVEHQHLRPVGLRVARRLRVQRGDRGLQREAARRAGPQRGHDSRSASAISSRSQSERSCSSSRSSAPGVLRVARRACVHEQQREQPARPRARPGSSARSMRARSSARSARSTRTSASPDGAVWPVVDSRCTTVSTASRRGGESSGAGTTYGMPRGGDLLLGPRHPRRHRRLADQERVRDVGGRHAAHEPQRQRHLRLARQRRVAAGEDEPQPVVGDHVVVLGASRSPRARAAAAAWPRASCRGRAR